MRSKQARKRFFLLTVVSAVIAASFYGLLYLPQRAELSAKQEETSRLRQEIAEASAFRRAHPSPEKDARSAEARTRLVGAMIPEAMDEGAFLAETEKKAAAAGISFLGVAPGDTVKMDGFAGKKLKLSVRGDYFALLDFLYALEQQGRFVKIDAVRGKTDDGGVFTGTVELWIYARSQ